MIRNLLIIILSYPIIMINAYEWEILEKEVYYLHKRNFEL